MYLTKRSSGIYHLYYHKPDGKITSISTKAKFKPEAHIFLTDFARQLAERNKQKTTPISLHRFALEFLKHSEALHTFWTNYSYKQTFRFLKKYFGDVSLTEITAKDISKYIEHRINTASVYQARKDLIGISAASNWAITQGYLLENPCKDVKKVKVPQKLPLFYTQADLAKLLAVIDNDDIQDIVTFAVNTGMRQMELIKLQWNQINLKDKIVILDNQHHITKGKRVRTIPLNANALQVLQGRDKNSCKVFLYNGEPMSQDFLSHKFAEYVSKAEINQKLNFHSLRHTFASWLVQAGVSIYEVSKLLGHADIKTTQIYAHLRSDDLRRSVELLE
jgi:integrase